MRSPRIRQVETWSAPVEGVRIRLRAEKRTWQAGEIPALYWDAENVGTRKSLHVTAGQRAAQLEVDGVWYLWPSKPAGYPIKE